MQHLKDSLSNQLTIQEVLNCLEHADAVDGLAFFGSHTRVSNDPVSDYDLLILISSAPIPIFQMLTYIDGRMADVVFIEIHTVDDLLAHRQPVSPTSFEGYFIQKMLAAEIVYDRSNRLRRIQHHARTEQLLQPTSESDTYAIWFWLNHGL